MSEFIGIEFTVKTWQDDDGLFHSMLICGECGKSTAWGHSAVDESVAIAGAHALTHSHCSRNHAKRLALARSTVRR